MKYQFELNEIKSCIGCPMISEMDLCIIYNSKGMTYDEYSVKKPSWCPLVEVKDGEK